MTTQPKALRLAEWLEADACDLQTPREAAAELRRLYKLAMDQNSEIFGLRLKVAHHKNATTDKQPEALRLADLLEPCCLTIGDAQQAVAAEGEGRSPAMTDRELLELAAKAAGVVWIEEEGQGWTHIDGLWTPWNPLTDDGDALRLAVKLRLPIDWVTLDLKSEFARCQMDEGEVWEPLAADDNAATRRAIVRAAAEIGAQQ